MIQLRNYQSEMVNNIRSCLANGIKRIVCQLPTGAGKTVIFSYIVKKASEKGKRCLILTNRIELLEQAGGTFEKFGIDYENITSRFKVVPRLLVTVGMVETLNNRLKNRLDFIMWFKAIDVIIIDECHIASFDKLFEHIQPNQIVLGFTATPHRKNKQKPLSDFFTELVQGISIGSLIKQKYLAKPKYYGVPVDLSSVKMKAGDFDEAGQTKVYGDNVIFEGLRENLNKYAKGKKTLIFCPSIETSRKVANDLGCLSVDSKMNKNQRNTVVSEFKQMQGGILANCGILATGFDCADIECVVLYRATTSLSLFLQIDGRGSRTTETKHSFIILDFGRNIQRHGFWHDEREWSLHPPKKRNANKEDVYPVKDCPECGCMVHARVTQCPGCGYIWEKSEKERVFAELQELSYSEIQEKATGASVAELEQMRIAKGYKVGWLLRQLKTEDKFYEYARLKGYKRAWVKHQKNYYENRTADSARMHDVVQ